MVRERQDVINSLVALLAEDTREEVTSLIEDVSDSWDEPTTIEVPTGITQEQYDELNEKYNASVKAYRERFTQGVDIVTEEIETEEEIEEDVKEIEDLFEGEE